MTQELKISNNLKILIVDDFESIRKALKQCLTRMGLRNIDESDNGENGLVSLKKAAALKEPYALIFCDINMPEMDGITMVEELRKIKAYTKTPVIMVSTENDRTTILDCIAAGATSYVIKPFSLSALKEKIYDTLSK